MYNGNNTCARYRVGYDRDFSVSRTGTRALECFFFSFFFCSTHDVHTGLSTRRAIRSFCLFFNARSAAPVRTNVRVRTVYHFLSFFLIIAFLVTELQLHGTSFRKEVSAPCVRTRNANNKHAAAQLVNSNPSPLIPRCTVRVTFFRS